jgi:hypothetical protein
MKFRKSVTAKVKGEDPKLSVAVYSEHFHAQSSSELKQN